MSQYIKVLKNFSCFAVTADDPEGRTKKSFIAGEKFYSLRRDYHSDRRFLNITCPEYLLLDVDSRNVYPLVDSR
jgi:hypothetical protein